MSFTGTHITAILSDPQLVAPIEGGDGEPEFAVVAEVNGEQNIVAIPVTVANALAHAIEHGHLLDIEGT